MSALLEAKGLSVRVGNRVLLHPSDLTIEPGEFIGLIGPNGAGKSTVLKALRGLIPRSGTVFIMGQDEKRMSEKEVARRIAFMPQEFQTTFGYTCRDIVLSGRYPRLAWWESLSERDREIARRCMAYTGTAALAERPIQSVSGGERQRVLLAKVLAQETPLLFLDEPTASLDLLYAEDIFRLCQRLSREGTSILMVCHDLTMAARWCSRLILLAHGSVMKSGAPKEVVTSENLAAAFGLRAAVYTDPVSGELSIYTMAPALRKRTSILLLGAGKKTTELIRLCVVHGYPVRCGYLPEGTEAWAAAAAFGVSFQKEKGKVQIENGDLILAFGLFAEGKERFPVFPSKARCMSDEKIPGADVKSWQDTCLLIEKEVLP